jgi:hypothetical protein
VDWWENRVVYSGCQGDGEIATFASETRGCIPHSPRTALVKHSGGVEREFQLASTMRDAAKSSR